MGEVRKIGDEYYVEFYARGLLYQQRAGKDKARAQKLLDDIETKIHQGEMGIIVRDVDVDIFFQTFCAYAQKEYSPPTQARYRSTVRHFEQFFCKEYPQFKKLSEVTPRVIEHYRSFLIEEAEKTIPKIKPRVINFTLYLLRDILDYAIKLGYLNDNPTVHVRFVKTRRLLNSPPTLSQQQLQKIFKQVSDDFRQILEFLLWTGLRLREMIALEWTDVDFQEKCFKIGNAQRFPFQNALWACRRVPLDLNAWEIINRRYEKKQASQMSVFTDQDGQRFKEGELKKQLAQLLKKSGLSESIHVYWFRHTFARNLLEKGVSLIHLSKILGLKDIAQVMRYEGFVPERWLSHFE